MPPRSTGCLKCRSRKIRCDEERPGCKKRRIHGVVCPGFKTAKKGDVEFQDQTDQTVQRLKIDTGVIEVKRDRKSSSSEACTPEKLTFAWAGFDAGPQQPPPKLRRTTPVTPVIVSPTAPIWPIHSPGAMRAQLYDMFLRLYVPQDVPTQGPGLWSSNKRFLHCLMELQTSSKSLLSHALDALCLVQIGSTYHNTELLNKAIEAYGKSLGGLAMALSKPEKLEDDTTLATTCVLSSCEFYTHFRVQGYSWVRHQHGMQRLMEQRGPSSVLNSPFALHLFYQLTTGSLAMSLMLRKRDPYATDKWSAVEAKADDAHDDYIESHRLGLRLPALLDRHDRLDLNHPGSLDDLDHLLFDCEQMEMDMKQNLMSMHAQDAREEKSWITLVEIEHFHPFAELVEDQTMTRALRFPSFQTGYIHSSHWLRMFMLRQTIRLLFNMRQQLVPSWQPPKKRVVFEKELLFYILSLCRLVPFFIETANGAAGDMCCFFMLYVAKLYFRTNGHWRWVRWVEHVSARVFTKGMSMPLSIQPAALPDFHEKQVHDHDENTELALNRIEFPNAPLLSEVGRRVTSQGTVWMPSRPATRDNSPTPSPPFSGTCVNGTTRG